MKSLIGRIIRIEKITEFTGLLVVKIYLFKIRPLEFYRNTSGDMSLVFEPYVLSYN